MNETALAWTFGMAAGIAATPCRLQFLPQTRLPPLQSANLVTQVSNRQRAPADQCAQADHARRKRAERELKHKERFRWN